MQMSKGINLQITDSKLLVAASSPRISSRGRLYEQADKNMQMSKGINLQITDSKLLIAASPPRVGWIRVKRSMR
ncbi:hypothetical protein H8E77_43370 [bacterium]|nr:hypothetical protein [bacterium]